MERPRRRWPGLAAGGIALVVAVGVLLNGAGLVDGAVGWWIGGRIAEAVSETPDGEVLDLAQVYAVDWDRAVLIHPYMDGEGGNRMLGFRHYRDDEILSNDDTVSRLVFVKGTEVLADVELHRVEFQQDLTGFSREHASFVVSHDSIFSTLDPADAADR